MVYRYTSTIVNKNERVEAHKKKAAKMAKKCGWVDPFDELPEETKKAFLSKGEIRMHQPKRGRKGFSRTKQENGRSSVSGNSYKDIKRRIADREYSEMLDLL
jgi:hypothetical protein